MAVLYLYKGKGGCGLEVAYKGAIFTQRAFEKAISIAKT
jgi:hypothetical protein